MTDRAIIQQVSPATSRRSRVSSTATMRAVRASRVRILGNREDAEEAIQDAFLRAFKALGDYEDRERFSAWLTRILVNQCRTVLARTKRRDAVFPELDPRRLDFIVAAGCGRWHAGRSWSSVLEQLPPEQREAIVLKYADDLTYEEMSRITGAGESALKMRVQRAFARLRALLQEVPSV